MAISLRSIARLLGPRRPNEKHNIGESLFFLIIREFSGAQG